MQKIVVSVYMTFIFLLSLLIVACGSNGSFHSDDATVDSLQNNIAALRYKSALHLHTSAIALDSALYANGQNSHSAINGKAYADFMMMNFAEAYRGYNHTIEYSENEIDILTAEVGLMQIYYRTSANREFFDYRSSVINRIKRINEEVDLLSDAELFQFFLAKVEFAAISHCYFANLGMYDELQKSVKLLRYYMEQVENPILGIYIRMILNYGTDIHIEKRIEELCRVHEYAENEGLLWLCANTRLMLALLLRDNHVTYPSKELNYLYGCFLADTMSVDKLPLQLALKAADSFEEYGDKYMMIEAMTIAASCNTINGYSEDAITLLDEAMREINIYYDNFIKNKNLSELSLYLPGDSTETVLMDAKDMYNIYECLLGVRHEASCAFAGMGDKYLSDINRNSYLDLLRSTRQNKRIESRIKTAENSASRLYIWLTILFVLLSISLPLSIFLNIKWRRRNAVYVNDLTRILRVCRMLMSSMPQELSDENSVYEAVAAILNKELSGFWPGVSFAVLPIHGDNNLKNKYTYDFKLLQINNESNSFLRVFMSNEELYIDKYDMLHILLPYISVAIDEGKRVANIEDEQLRLKQLQCVYKLNLHEYKRENVVKRTIMSVVNGMRPYMNRMLNELNNLAQVPQKGIVEIRRLDYLSELTIILDDYNIALEHWIKLSSGELNLHIENFRLSELLKIIAKGEQAFAMKGIHLIVDESNAVVKADKALTLFMMNTLVDNAGKFTDKDGKVSLTVVEADRFVEVAVTDTGKGMTAEEVGRLQNDKIYMYHAGESKSGKPQKGGFGLMNCKGIIDKYRKTDDLFSVCSLNISSKLGEGTRVSFRLPKGVIKGFISFLLLLLPCSLSALNYNVENVDALADSVYVCNVDGDYSRALVFAQQAISELNNCYREVVGGNDTISLIPSENSEVSWWRGNLFPDSLIEHIYYNLLDIRNETAVAALALNDWALYRYNNSVYTLLYRLVHEDKDLIIHYDNMQKIANYRYAAVAVCIAIFFMLFIVYMVMYVRNVVMKRMNTRMLLDTNLRLLRVVNNERGCMENIADKMANEIYHAINEQMRIECVSLFLKKNTTSYSVVSPEGLSSRAEQYVYKVFEAATPYFSNDGMIAVLPLMVAHSEENVVLGALAFSGERRLDKNEIVTLELITSYAASMLYYSTVCLAAKYENLDEIEEEMERVKFEQNNMHVRNLVLDNCLSVIKHETIYYPGRIRKLVHQLIENDNDSNWNDRVATIREVMDYYNSVFAVLSECAMRQLDDIAFSLSSVDINDIILRMKKQQERKAALRNNNTPDVCYTPVNAVVIADETLVEYLFQSIFQALFSVSGKGEIIIRVNDSETTVNVEFTDTRRTLSQDEKYEFFLPIGKTKEHSDSSGGMGFLIAKEIIRIHEDYTDKRGGRIEVDNNENGMIVKLTLPK